MVSSRRRSYAPAWCLGAFLIAAAASAHAEYHENVEYGRPGDSSLRLDANIPDGTGPFPAAIIVHGGGWVLGDRKRSVEPLFQPLSSHGFAWFSISYRLPTDLSSNGFAAALMLGRQIDDVRQAVAYVKGHASEYHVDATRIVLIGESAGGQLAEMAALKPARDGGVRAVVAFYSPGDLAMLARTATFIPDSVRQVVKNSALDGMLMAGLADLSPVNWVRKDSPPFLLIHGTADGWVPIEQSKLMCEKMHAVGGRCELYPVEGAGHGIRWWEAAGVTAYKERMMSWLEKVMSGS
jgi:acetyl esterase/lipase